jgi:hypothetical protein
VVQEVHVISVRWRSEVALEGRRLARLGRAPDTFTEGRVFG